MAGQLHVDQDHDDEEFRSRNGCFGFLFLHSGNMGNRTGYRSLLHEDGAANVGCWEGSRERARRLFSRSIGGVRWREVANNLQGRRRRRRRRNNDKITTKKKTGFNYDPKSYWLNFDDGDAADSIPRATDVSGNLKTQR